MCEPRRVEITVTRQVREAWEREIERVAEVSGTVTGEARIRQPLDASVGESALRALHAALARGVPGWTETEAGYRHEVEGGHVVYDPETRSLEITATRSETLTRQGQARDRLAGVLDEEITSRAEAGYYADNWGGHTRERAEAEARQAAERTHGEAVRQRLATAVSAAEESHAAALAAAAESDARRAWDVAARQRRDALAARASDELREVGSRARLAVNRLLAGAYRDALLALARRRGVAEADIHRHETADTLEIEFVLPDR